MIGIRDIMGEAVRDGMFILRESSCLNCGRGVRVGRDFCSGRCERAFFGE